MDPHIEDWLVNAFVVKPKRARYRDLLRLPRKRRALLDRLHPAFDLDLQGGREIKPTGEPYHVVVLRMLREAGAPPDCYFMSTDDRYDGRVAPLAEALETYNTTWRTVHAMLISCVPHQLACYMSDEGHALLLKYPNPPARE